jgi:hypothetical protein
MAKILNRREGREVTYHGKLGFKYGMVYYIMRYPYN